MTNLCQQLLSTIDNYPSFDFTVRRIIDPQIQQWSQFPVDQRPGFDCLESVWMRERRPTAMAQPSDVAEVLLTLINKGGIDPFHGLTSDNIDEHVLTSRRPSSACLRRSLRGLMKAVVASSTGGEGVSSSTFLRAIALGFAWDEEIPGQETMQALAESAAPQDLMLGYRLSTRMASEITGHTHDPMATDDVERSRRVADGIVECLRSRLVNNAMGGPAQETEAKRVIRVIELERVVRGMVGLLSSSASRADLLRWFKPHATDGPLAHLRRYAALGEPLMDLVGNTADADVRREFERIMDVPSIVVGIAGFPSIERTSRRPSDLLRRLRFLVYEIIRRAGIANAGEMFHQFRFGLFDGSRGDLMLAASKLAFTRPEANDPVLVRAELENLVERSGLRNAQASDVHQHLCLKALRRVAVIEIDTWSEGEGGADAYHLLDALRGVIGSLEEQFDLEANDLLRLVFDRQLCALAAAAETEFGYGPERSAFFRALSALHQDASDPTKDAVRAGLDEFRTLVTSNYHREFDRVELRALANARVFEQVDELDGISNGEQCREWLLAWAAVDGDAGALPIDVLALDTVAAMTAMAVANPFQLVDSSREPMVFHFADAAAGGLKSAEQALLDLVSGPGANILFGTATTDAVGRSLAVVIAQTGSRDLVDRLFGYARRFQLPFDSSIDGVTPLMAAVRHARDGSTADASAVDAVIDCDPSALTRRDRRGWRAIHHAFAAGRVDIARKLAAKDPTCLHVLPGDSTTFLIEAFACTRITAGIYTTNVVSCAIELLRGMPDSGQRNQVLAFRGPDSGEGMPRSLVSAVVSTDQHWQQFMNLNEAYAAQAHQIWADVGSAVLRRLVDKTDSLELGEVLRRLRGVGGDLLHQMVAGITHPPVAVRIAEGVINAALVNSAGLKFNDLRAVDQLKITATSPYTGGTMFHGLLNVEEARRDNECDIKNSDLYALVIRVISAADPADAMAAVTHLDFERESAIRKASRVGETALALSFARAIGWPVSFEDQELRWSEAARVLVNPDRYQDGIKKPRRVGINAQNQLTVPVPGLNDPVVVSSSPLPFDLDRRSARDWLKQNASEIAKTLNKAIDPSGHGVQVGLHDFVNWMAHLSKES
jgi:hypothetical protein